MHNPHSNVYGVIYPAITEAVILWQCFYLIIIQTNLLFFNIFHVEFRGSQMLFQLEFPCQPWRKLIPPIIWGYIGKLNFSTKLCRVLKANTALNVS